MPALFRQLVGFFCLLVLLPAFLPAYALPLNDSTGSLSVSLGGDLPAEEEDESSDHALKFFTPAASSVAPSRRTTTATSAEGFKPGICLEIPTPPPLRA